MTTKVLITFEGNTPLLRREVIDLYHIQYINQVIESQAKQPAYYVPLLLGITKAALNNPSFISAASFQETVALALATRTIKCAIAHNLSTIVAVGGVAANSALRSRLVTMSAENNIRAIFPPLSLCTDNAAMIACAGAIHLSRGETSSMNIATRSRLNLEDCQSLYI